MQSYGIALIVVAMLILLIAAVYLLDCVNMRPKCTPGLGDRTRALVTRRRLPMSPTPTPPSSPAVVSSSVQRVPNPFMFCSHDLTQGTDKDDHQDDDSDGGGGLTGFTGLTGVTVMSEGDPDDEFMILRPPQDAVWAELPPLRTHPASQIYEDAMSSLTTTEGVFQLDDD